MIISLLDKFYEALCSAYESSAKILVSCRTFITKALDKGNNEFTADQLKLLVTQGQQQLLLVMKEDKCYVALTVQWINYPNDRVAYITYIGGKTQRQGLSSLNSGSNIMVELQYRGLLNLRV